MALINSSCNGEIGSYSTSCKEAVAAYDRDGVICLRGAISADWLAGIDNLPADEFLTTSLVPGDMLIRNSHTFHSVPANRLDRRRAAFSINWVGADVTYEDVSAQETYRGPGLKTGDVIISEKFPLVMSL